MRCHDICENLSAYIDGMLDQSDASLVELHLENCPGCRAEYLDLLTTVELVRDLPEVELPPGFRDELKKRMITAGSFESAPKPATRRLFGGRWVGMVAAAAVIFITVGVTALWYDEKGMLSFPGFGDKVAGESELAQNKVADRASGTSEPDANMKELEAADVAGKLRMKSAPGSEESTYSGVQEDTTEAPTAMEFQLPADIARERGTLMDAADNQFSIAAVPESEQNEEQEPRHYITALTDEEKAARDAAPPGMGGGPSLVVEYSLSIQVDDKQKTTELVSNVVAKHGGFVEPQQEQLNDYMLVTVPFYNAQSLIEEIGLLGMVTDRQSEKIDMATEIQQLEKNISNLQAHEIYLAGQLQNQADQAVENELTKVREQIAGLQAELAAVNTSIMMSKVILNISDL